MMPSGISLAFCGLFFFISVSLHGQIGAVTDYPSDRSDGVQDVRIRWSAADEAAWHARVEDRLDIMGIRTGIHSSALPRPVTEQSRYRFDPGRDGLVELLISVERLVPGESLYLRDMQRDIIIFDLASQSAEKLLTPAFDPADAELIWHTSSNHVFQSEFTIESIYYQPAAGSRSGGIGFGAAMACHPNIACKEDSISQLIARSAVRMRLVMEEGIGWCSGAFVNTTKQDKTPYLLTAFHCQHDFTPLYSLWRFDLFYVSPECENPPSEPTFLSLTGCTPRALRQASDFLLVELTKPIPKQYNITFAGWDRDDVTVPDTVYHVHHPRADIRKFSTCTGPIVIHPNQIGWTGGYSTPPHSHLRFKFTEGGHEAGSSGGPVFNKDGFLVGQLHGGTVGCEAVNSTYIGRFSKSWGEGENAGERLRDWLDPDQTGLAQLPSLENNGPGIPVDITGRITDPLGRPVKNVVVEVTGDTTVSLLTGADGTFILLGLNPDGEYVFTPSKTDFPKNGVNVVDLTNLQRHLLGLAPFTHPWQLIAADANHSLSASAIDVIEIQRLILGIYLEWPHSPSWRFTPQEVHLQAIPPGGLTEIEFMAIKTGDVNASADPQR